jgi:Zn-dependent protease
MGWSITIAKIAGTQIRIHVTFVLFLVWIGFLHYKIGGTQAAVSGLLFITSLFLCVLLHELGHVIAAKRFGILTPDITLLPIGGVARMQRMPDKPVQEIIVAFAGPLVTLLIAVVISLAASVPFGLTALGGLMGGEQSLAARLVSVNLSLLLFNLIPAFPMDGGRVFRAILATRMNYGEATRIAARVGQGFAFLFGFLGLFGNPLLIFMAKNHLTHPRREWYHRYHSI